MLRPGGACSDIVPPWSLQLKQHKALLLGAAVLGDAEVPVWRRAKLTAPPCAWLPQVDASSYALVENRAVHSSSVLHLQPSSARKTYFNLPVEQMHAPIIGAKPCLACPDAPQLKATWAGGN